MTPADVQVTFCATLVDQWVAFGLRHAPEFEDWLTRMRLINPAGRLRSPDAADPLLRALTDMTQAA